ncbi:MAG: YcaO-like family protein [Candidatus Pacebacteria bacterium]|nr:YcaO-like family protein [Candidatus Paceibacterota bacterium]
MNKEKIYDKEYLPIKDYISSLKDFKNMKTWRIPLDIRDRIHFFILSFFAKVSVFSDTLLVENPTGLAPGYTLILAYLKRYRIIESFQESPTGHPGYYFFSATKSFFVNDEKVSLFGQGIAQSKNVAISKAIGEILERVVSGFYDLNQKVYEFSINEGVTTKKEMLNPSKVHHFLGIQKESYRELGCGNDEKIMWVKGKSLLEGKTIFIPKQMTSWFGFGKARSFNNILIHPTSNGCAGYFTKEGAVLRGLLEVVNRDGFLVHWLTKTPPKKIDNHSLPRSIKEKIKVFNERGISLHILDVESLGIPSVFIVAIVQGEIPGISLSGSAALTYEEAIEAALDEMVMVLNLLDNEHHKNSDKRIKNFKPFISTLNMKDRSTYWRSKEKVDLFTTTFLKGEGVTFDFVSKKDLVKKSHLEDASKIQRCIEALSFFGDGYLPVVYFPEHPIQKVLNFFIVQVFVERAFPLYLTEYYGTFASERLQEFAQYKNVSSWELNKHPHMFT